MRKITTLFLSVVICSIAAAQSREALEGQHTLQERYNIMKDKAESYGDYKVIKNNILDGVWKIHMDSIARTKEEIRTAQTTIAKLQGDLTAAGEQVKKAQQEMEQSAYEKTHLSVFGIHIAKGVFVTSTLVVLGGLVIALITVLGTFNTLRKSNKEKELTVFSITSEFDQFRKKALEKEVKISRELQSERNKLAAFSSEARIKG